MLFYALMEEWLKRVEETEFNRWHQFQAGPVTEKSALSSHGFNRGMKGGIARCLLLRALRGTCFVFLVIWFFIIN
jgi:hypothetical protein